MQFNRPLGTSSWAQLSQTSTNTSSTSSSSSSSGGGGGQPAAGAAHPSVSSGSSAGSLAGQPGRGTAGPAPTGVQEEPSAEQRALDEEQRQEESRKLRLQLYVFVLRCISYPFNAKQTNSAELLHHKQQQAKLRRPQLEQIVQLHSRFVRASGSFAPKNLPHRHLRLAANQMSQLDELYEQAHRRFGRKFLHDERMRLLVESECCSQQDLRELFRLNAEQLFRLSGLLAPERSHGGVPRGRRSPPAPPTGAEGEPECASLLASKDVILNSWLLKFEAIVRDESAASSAPPDAPHTPTEGGLGVAPAGASPTSAAIVAASSATLAAPLTPAGQPQGQPAAAQQLSKEQLYQMFQNILSIKKFEHQLLYNALQLDSTDEQAAAIRRELDGRISRIAELERNKKLLPKFVLKEMESLYLEECRAAVNKLMVNLDSLPVIKGSSAESRGVYGLQKFRRYNSRAQASLTRDGLVESHPSEPTLTKLDVVLTFNIEVIVMEVRGLRHLAPQREIYCTMEIEGSERLQTEHVQARKPLWDTQGDFTSNHPLPVLKIKLYAVNPSMLSLEDKELGKLVLRPTVLSPKTPEWCSMQPSQAPSSSAAGPALAAGPADQELKIRVVVRMDRPQQLKHCGYLWGIGKSTWRKLKRRYHTLIQVSQYTFVMCSYREKKAKPTEMLQLDGYTVDYIEPPTDLIMEHCSEMTSTEHHSSAGHSSTLGLAGRLASAILKQPAGGGPSGSAAGGTDAGEGAPGGESDQPSAIQTAAALSDELHSKHYFNVVKEGDSVVFACDDEQECFGWVMALYRATGQAHKPTPLRNQYGSGSAHYLDAAFAAGGSAAGSSVGSAGSSSLSISSMLNGVKGPKSSVDVADQRARKHGMDEFISADPCKFQHNQLFRYLQHETLRYRLDEPLCSLGWFSQGQVLVLDEYCARYGVRTCYRHLAYLSSLLDFNQRSYFIDQTLLNYGFDFCASQVSGNASQAHPMGSVNFDLRPDGVGTVTVEERDLFHSLRGKLLQMIERQIANFSYCFPFGKPDGALKATLSLLERVLMKEQQTSSMVQNEEVRALIRKCLEQAALNNYTKLSGQANLLGPPPPGRVTPPAAPSPQFNAAHTSCAGSPVPLGMDEPSAGSFDTPTGSAVSAPLAAIGARLRTASNLSSSSVASGNSSSVGSSASVGGQSVSSAHSDSFRRRQCAATSGQDSQQCLTMAMIINNEHVKPAEKLRRLIRLAELCCEQAEDNNEFFSDDFAWHSDLMLDHFELFWSLFSVDMDKILAELNGGHQIPGGQLSGRAGQSSSLGGRSSGSLSGPSGDILSVSSREAFSLFQVLNNHMRKSSNLECRKFKAHLCDTFKPRLLRYIDIMESTLTRMLFKACERDGQVNCMMIEQMFAKLDDLQRFVLVHLRWPEEQLAEQLNQRLKLIAYEICDACVQRTQSAFQQLDRRASKWTATTTSYSSPVDMILMINVVLDTRSRSLSLCTFNNFDQMSYHSKIDKLAEAAMGEMQPGLMAKMLNALDSTLTKLARYDEGNLLAPILSLTTKQGMSSSGRDIGRQYVSFVSNCCELLRHKINDELWIVNLLEDWYATQMNVIYNWLAERIDQSLHEVQLIALTNIMPKVFADMSLQGVSEEKLNLKSYQTIMSRLKMEEAAAMAGGSLFEQPSTSIFNTSSILSSLTSSSSSAADKSAGSQQQQSAPSAAAASQSSATAAGLATPLRQPAVGSAQSRRMQAFGSGSGSSSDQLGSPAERAQADGDNIADRALQSATRMFKGFWPS